MAAARQVQGKPLSYNNIADTDAAFELVSEFAEHQAAVAIIKHANPCGVAVADSLSKAYEKALACDPVSAFGGIAASTGTLDADAAEAITRIFTEVVIAPDADEAALDVLRPRRICTPADHQAARSRRRPGRSDDRWRAGCWCRSAMWACAPKPI